MPTSSSKLAQATHEIFDLEKKHIVQSYGRLPVVIERGDGCFVYDTEGKRYLDFVSGIGVNALGHRHPRILAAIHEQCEELIHCSNLYYHKFQAPLARRLAELSGLDRAFFANSGTEAVEGALKMARAYGRKQSRDKFEIVALNNSFAGRTLGAVSITGQPKHRDPFEPLLEGVRFVDFNNVAALEAAVSERTAAIFFEPIQGEGGINEVSRGFAARARQLADERDALLVFDEIQCGLGRTGRYFAFQAWNEGGEDPILPDVMTLAKPLGGGLPIGALLANERAAGVIQPGLHGSTFGGNALVCRVALEFLDALPELLPSVGEQGVYFQDRLQGLADKYDAAVEARGRGLMLALQLSVPGKELVGQAMERGFLINCTAGNVLRFLPSYVIEREHIDELVGTLDELLANL